MQGLLTTLVVPLALVALLAFLPNSADCRTRGDPSATDRPSQEFTKLLTGEVPPELDRRYRKALCALPPLAPLELPSRFDWRDSLIMSPVRDQECGDCWAQAAVAAVESQMRMRDGDTTLLSVQQAIDCNYFNASCSGGWPHSVYTLYKMVGAVSDDCYPYAGFDMACAQDTCDFILNTDGWEFIDSTEVSIKTHVMSHGPLVAWMEAWPDMGGYAGGCYENYDPTLYGHLILISGWDDAMCDGYGAWLIKNSWGSGWGENGYGWIKYDVGRIGYLATIVQYTPREEAKLVYQSYSLDDSSGDGDGRPDPGETVTIAVTLRNIRWGTATGASATVISTTPGVEVLTGSATFPDIASGETAESDAPHFAFTVHDTVDCGARLNFILSMTSDQGLSTARLDMAAGYYNVIFSDPAEVNLGWVRDPGDDAVYGTWLLTDPQGSLLGDSVFVQSELDHTPGNGFRAYITQNAKRYRPPDQRDVDGGRATLISPAMDLSGYHSARLTYWRWYTNDTDTLNPPDDYWLAEISSDSGGTWIDLENTWAGLREWVQKEFRVEDYIPLTDRVLLRFIASDYGADNTVEAAVDDIEIVACTEEDPAGVEENVAVDTPEHVTLLGSRHNPFANSTHIFFGLPQRVCVSLRVYDARGRVIRELPGGIKSAGYHSVRWDGRTQSGAPASPGVYFVMLEAGSEARTAKVVLATQ
jgi:hypothetical protein